MRIEVFSDKIGQYREIVVKLKIIPAVTEAIAFLSRVL